MLTLFVRTTIFYLLVVAALRVMGKRQLGELQPSELVVAIMISDLASIPIENTENPLLEGIIPIITLVGIEFVFSILVIKSEFFRTVITGRPVLIICRGKIRQKELRRLRLSLDDLLEELRLNGYSDISEVDTVLLETNGQISVIPKEESRPVTGKDLKLNQTQTHLAHTIIADGKIRKNGLRAANISKETAIKLLKERGAKSPEEVFYMNLTDQGNVHFEKKE